MTSTIALFILVEGKTRYTEAIYLFYNVKQSRYNRGAVHLENYNSQTSGITSLSFLLSKMMIMLIKLRD